MHRATQEMIGRLGLFRESPGMRLIVKILTAGVTTSTEGAAPYVELELEVLAAYSGSEFELPATGVRFTVGCTLPPTYFGGMWTVEPLAADTLEAAIPEAEGAMGMDGSPG